MKKLLLALIFAGVGYLVCEKIKENNSKVVLNDADTDDTDVDFEYISEDFDY